MILQAWLVLFTLVILIIYSIVMTIVSEKFRHIVRLNNKSIIAFFFIALFVFLVLTVFSVECAIVGGTSGVCKVYSWVVTSLVIIIVIGFVLKTLLSSPEKKVKVMIEEETKNKTKTQLKPL